ncbi:uncharacterized protein LOC118436788 [Folsomia candida]|uniref:uncharacterized protein LOC118436788 n=1 Tax=Folsomia candida TaxID=158441 RepID=UPI0016053321|nr:uncharacterized protein LOC118436788 [Folsomia candida]
MSFYLFDSQEIRDALEESEDSIIHLEDVTQNPDDPDGSDGQPSNASNISDYDPGELGEDDNDHDEPSSKQKKLSSGTHKGGRMKDQIWDSYMEIGDDFWGCKTCQWKNKNPKADRLRKHLNDGSKKRKLPILAAPVTATNSMLPTSSTTKASLNYSQSSIKDHFISTSDRQQLEINQKLQKAICSSNIPFRVLENEHFIEWVKSMRPSYKLPTPKASSTYLLDNLYRECEQNIISKIENQNATIMQDGWSTNQKEFVIAHSIFVKNKVYFIDTVCPGEEEKTAENCTKWLQVCRKEAEEKFSIKIVACVTDNCNTMEKMRRDLGKELLCYGDNPHLLNLVGKKASPEKLIQKIIKVQKFFRNHDFVTPALKNSRPVLPSETRWNSQIDCLESYITNQGKYLEIACSDDRVNDEVKTIIENGSIFRQANDSIKLLEPIAIALNTLQKDSSMIFDAVHEWIKLKKELPQLFTESYYKDKFAKGTPAFAIAAYMIHPIYRGADLHK